MALTVSSPEVPSLNAQSALPDFGSVPPVPPPPVMPELVPLPLLVEAAPPLPSKL
jgi:hypothetical protein